MSSLAGLNKKIFNFLQKKLILAIFGSLGPTWKLIFSTYRKSFRKSVEFLLRKVNGNFVLNFELSIFEKRGFASRHFLKSVFLASCIFMVRPFVAS